MSGLDLQRVSEQLRGVCLRGPLLYHSQTGSTNDDARALAAAGAAEGTTVIAGEQTHGRGRHQRSWFGHPDHSLLFSLVLRPALPSELFPRLVNTIGVGVAAGCAAAAGQPVGTKWPNDIIAGGRKVGGILLEARPPNYAIAGIGLNVLGDTVDLPPELRATAGSLAACALAQFWEGSPDPDHRALESPPTGLLRREDVLAGVLNEIDNWYGVLLRGDWASIIGRQRELETTLGQERTIAIGDTSLTGTVRDLSPEGGLVLDTPQGSRTFSVGEVS
jgi:BirA family biotin operon repressor/biotin-[acetyl-CoA-carboxylase] ligase